MAPTDPPSSRGEGAEVTRLRPAERDELGELVQLQLRARRAAPMPAHAWSVDELTDQLRDGLGADQVWVAEAEDSTLLGFVRFVLPDEVRVGWLDDLYVDPAGAGQGIGTSLLDLVKSFLPDGFGLWVFERNLPARAFYRARGLVEVGMAPAEESPEGEVEVQMAWPGAATSGTT